MHLYNVELLSCINASKLTISSPCKGCKLLPVLESTSWDHCRQVCPPVIISIMVFFPKIEDSHNCLSVNVAEMITPKFAIFFMIFAMELR